MTTRATFRNTAALFAALTLTAATGALAQAPTKARAGTGSTRLADCDYIVSSCGGSPYLDGLGGYGGGSSGGASGGSSGGDSGYGPKYVCDENGNGTECKRVTTERCTAWVVTSANGTVTVTVGASTGGTIGAGGTRTCAETVTTVSIWHLLKV